MRSTYTHALLFCLFFLFPGYIELTAQTTTNASMGGLILDENNEPLIGVNVVATHLPSGTEYGATTRDNGRYTIPAMRVGGPYQVEITYIGFETVKYDNISLRLGTTFDLDVVLREGVYLDEVEIISLERSLINEKRTGASTNIGVETLETMPTLSRSVTDFTRLTPQSSGTSFGGQDAKAVNFTVDGSILTNAFGLSGALPGASTNSTPISLDAIEQIQVNIAPYDVTQGGFVGAGINAITRSGDNEFRGSVFFNTRNESMVGNRAGNAEVLTSDFNVNQVGFRLGGPIIKNKLFFFVNAELEDRMDPGSAFRAAAPGRTGDNVTRVQLSDLEQLSNTLRDRFGYETGRFEDFSLPTNSTKILAKLDYNINANHNLSVRFNMLQSLQGRDAAATSLGFGGRNRNLFSMNYENTNYLLNDNFYSGIAELNSIFSNKFSNTLTVGYTSQTNFRSYGGGDFPAVDILEGGRNYISFGTDVLSPNRSLNSEIWQFQNNFTAYLNNHTLTVGVNLEAFNFDYTFTPAFFGQYVYNSLDDFYSDINGEPVELRRFQRTFSGLPGGGIPTANTQAYIASAYVQDEINFTRNFRVTAGVRLDVPFYGQTAVRNPAVEEQMFLQPNGNPITIQTDKLPDPQYMINPRLGFNWDVLGDRTFQLRGGSGMFTGRPIYINISNMVNLNGITLGTIREDFTSDYPFNPDVNAYIPQDFEDPDTYEIAYIDRNFRNPQVWRSNFGIDKDFFNGLVGTFEAIYTQQMADLLFYDSNLRPAQRNLAGPDQRLIYGFSDEANRLNPNVSNATVMTNTDMGYSYSLTWQLTKQFNKNFHGSVAYNYAVSKNMADGNTQHFLSYENIQSVNGGNYPTLGFSLDDQRHRVISTISYRKEYGKRLKMASGISMFFEFGNQGVFSYTYNGDANGDQIAGNDLIYVPTSQELQNMQFRELTLNGGSVVSPQQQRELFDNFINQDRYLSSRRGEYASRHGVQLPATGRLDLSFTQEFFFETNGKRNVLQLRADIINITNLINRNWGIGYSFVNDSPISIVDIDEITNIPTYQLNPVGNTITQESFLRTATTLDVWQMQLGVRYIFN